MDYQEVKRKIKNCRDILVGIVPSPEAQVQQITIALMYKFMDDMDKKEQEENDAPPMFFAGEFTKYSWTKLLAPQVGSQERMNLYAEAIEKMNENKGIPQLFRDVFKGAFLPYRNPETLSMFLKEINGFTYDNSENLGNAFEHLLSIMGSQGDAGMFRTPRHIIDFIVDAVDPQKNEQICDPACGSAGFLISAFNHIIKTNTKDKKGDLLSPDEKKKLIKNFVGYDISPDMVRLSKVNLYLHGFPSPTIFEYDTLSSEEKWDENFDVILANPPFMSPKGGIRPHKRFSVQANRSEVLFVDYILEHLRPNGRAGIIVPEGIIFQSATAYKALRKLLIEDGLLAVVSLPAGVFNPYAGVKTSILLFDNGLAKKTKEILFLKIQNDGYGLGAQRREIDKNDLPLALEIIKKYRAALKDSKKFGLNAEQAKIAHLVAKDKIVESGDYNLSGDRYIEAVNFANQKWPMVELGEVCDIINGYAFKSENYVKSGVRIIRITNVQKGKVVDDNPKFYPIDTKEPIEKYKLIKNDLLLSLTGNVGRVGLLPKEFLPAGLNQRVACLRATEDKINSLFLYYILNRDNFEQKCMKSAGGIAQKNLSTVWLSKYKIPLPPFEIQKEIVEQIEVKQNAIDHAKAIIQNLERERRYFGQSLRKLEDVEWVKLGDVCETTSGGTPLKSKQEFYQNGTIPWLKSGEVNQGFIYKSEEKITASGLKNSSAKLFPVNTVLVAMYGATAGKVGMLKFESSTNQAICGILPNDKFVPEFLYFYLRTLTQEMVKLSGGGAQPNISQTIIKTLKIPLPPFEIQKRLVAEAEKEQQIINSNKQLIEIYEQKIADVLSEI